MRHAINWQLLSKYLAGECSPDEVRAVNAWLEADPARQQLMDELTRIWAASDSPPSAPADVMDLDAEWGRLSEAMEADPQAAPPRDDRPRRHAQRRRSRTGTPSFHKALYALLAGLLLIGSLWLGIERWTPATSEAAFREVIAERGERAEVQLVDGTRVTLNVDSRLRVPTAFDAPHRTVHLEGEAYFDVATDSTRPFIVHTGDAVVNVHGTAFNVRSYPEDGRVQVAVVEGAVSLHPQQAPTGNRGARLEPGQVGRLAVRDTVVTTQSVGNVEAMIGWMDGRLIFEDEALPEVADRLARWYNLQFDIAEPALDSLRLTASLKSRSVENVLDVITATLGIEYRLHQNTVVLSDDAPPLRPPHVP